MADSPDILQLVVRSLHDVLLVADLEGRVVMVSDSVERVTGRRRDELVGRPLAAVLGADGARSLLELLDRHGLVRGFDVRVTGPGGAVRWLSLQANHVRDPGGAPVAIVAIGSDVTDRRRGDEVVRALVHSIEQGAVAFLLLSADGTVSYVNRTFCELYGYAAHEMVGRSVHLLSGEPDPTAHYAAAFAEAQASGVWRGEDLRRRKDGTVFPASTTLSRVPDSEGRTICFSEASRDNRERVERVEHLTAISIHDAVTGIYNRRYYNDFLEKAWGRATREGTSIGLVLADIDHFKRFNDYYGHVRGDECLSQVAGAMAAAVRRPSDALARYGGEEFVAVLGDTEREGALHVAERLRAAVEDLRIPHERSSVAAHVTISVGVATSRPERSAPPDGHRALVQAADAALFGAKERGRNRVEEA